MDEFASDGGKGEINIIASRRSARQNHLNLLYGPGTMNRDLL